MCISVCSQHTVRIKESTHFGIIVPALQVIQSRFGIEIVPSVTEGIDICHCAGGGKNISLAVVGVGCHNTAIGSISNGNNIPLQISCVKVGFRSVIEAHQQSAFVVEEVQAAVACFLPKQLRAVPVVFGGYAVNGSAGAQPGFVIGIACGKSFF